MTRVMGIQVPPCGGVSVRRSGTTRFGLDRARGVFDEAASRPKRQPVLTKDL